MLAVFDDFRTRDLEHWPDQSHCLTDLSNSMYAAQAVRPGASEQPHNDRFNLIVLSVCGQYQFAIPILGNPPQKIVTQASGGRFEVFFPRARRSSDIDPLNDAIQLRSDSKVDHEFLIRIRFFAAQPVIEMGNEQGLTVVKSDQCIEQRGRVSATGDGNRQLRLLSDFQSPQLSPQFFLECCHTINT